MRGTRTLRVKMIHRLMGVLMSGSLENWDKAKKRQEERPVRIF